jgi:murein DD-endopeptidase MepM/ murein hydrolase activator NlpD
VHGYNNPGTGDAVDFFGPKGEPVYAAHDGTIRRIADPGGKLSCLYINGNHVLTVYAHVSIKPGLRLGSLVKEGQVIGWIGKRLRDPHLHFECWLNGKALTGRTPGEVARKMAGALGD